MSSGTKNAIEKFQTLYLNEDGADVWFCFGDKRIPAHKLILSTMTPWFKTMFFGSLREGNEVNMTHSNVSADAFKEFLRFLYLNEANLTMDNIDGVMDLAKQSMIENIFTECEDFLIKSLTSDTICFGYQLALLYESERLKAFCEDEICVNAEQILRSSSFMDFHYDFLQNVLQCDALACEEKYIFHACIAWAKAACKRNDLDPSEADNLRKQLKKSLYQIRFNSMTKEEVATCISSCPGLFAADELEEIIRMIGHPKEHKPQIFNWTPRYYNLQWDKGHQLKCKRINKKVTRISNRTRDYWWEVEDVEQTTLTCNRRILLKGFDCECNELCSRPAVIQITEKRCNDPDQIEIECYNDQLILEFKKKPIFLSSSTALISFQASVKLDKVILLRPNYVYKIKITFENDPPEVPEAPEAPGAPEAADAPEAPDAPDIPEPREAVETPETLPKHIYNRCVYKKKVLLDYDIMIRFGQNRGIISALSLSRFDHKKFIQKIASSPKAWFR